MARITKESLLQLSKELEILTAEETKTYLGGTDSTVHPLGNKKDKEPVYVAPPLPEVIVTPSSGSLSYDEYMYNLGYNKGYKAGQSERIMDDIVLGLGALLAPNATTKTPGVGYDATTYPDMSLYSNGVIDGLIDGRADKDAKKK